MDSVAFIAKKVVGSLLCPLGFSLFLIFLGAFIAWVRRKARLGLLLVITGAALLYVLSCPITGFLLLNELEAEAGQYADPEDLHRKGVHHIVVLGGSIVTHRGSAADRYGDSIFRTVEAIRLWRAIPGSMLVISAGSTPEQKSDKEAMAELPVQLGVPKEAMVLITEAWDTRDEAKIVAKIVGRMPFALVTSAIHMPRAMRIFQSAGMKPIACPCHFKTLVRPPMYSWLLADAEYLRRSQSAVHEYVGRTWHVLTRKVLD